MTELSKSELRRTLRSARKAHVEALPANLRALMFHRPPAPLLARIGDEATIGLYHAATFEAPTAAYAKFFHEAGHPVALPHFDDRSAHMTFRRHSDPYDGSDLVAGPFGTLQPHSSAEDVAPDVLFVPLIGFTADGQRLGQGGGHYDRWMAEQPPQLSIGLAWDAQLCDALPTESHDRRLDVVVTPTRIYGLN